MVDTDVNDRGTLGLINGWRRLISPLSNFITSAGDAFFSEKCIRCKEPTAYTGFCVDCSIRMVPKIYACPRCRKEFTRSSLEPACADCRTRDESDYLRKSWYSSGNADEGKHKSLSRIV